MSELFGTLRVSRRAFCRIREQYFAASRLGAGDVFSRERGFSTSSPCQKRGRTLAKLLSSADPTTGYRSLTFDEQSWLSEHGYESSQIARWITVLHTHDAEIALKAVSTDVPNFLILHILRLPAISRETFYKMVRLFKEHLRKLDNSSCIYAIESLVRHGLLLDPELLSLLDEVWRDLPESFGAYVFNRLLSKLSGTRSTHPQIATTQNILVGIMHSRHQVLDRRGYVALLSSSVHDPVRNSEIESLMISAGYTLEDSPWRKRKQVSQEVSKVFASVRSATKKRDYLDLYEAKVAELDSPRFWTSLFALQDNNQHALRFCITLLEAQKVDISPVLARLMLKRCRSPTDMHIVEAIVKEIASHDMCLGIAGWIEYIKCLIFAGRQAEALEIIVNDPGGNAIIDMPGAFRKETNLWSATVKALNKQRKSRHSGRKHAKYLGKIIQAIEDFRVPVNPALLNTLLEGAILSGPRAWGNRHSCDTAVTLFKKHVNLGNEPWKIRGDEELWTRYLLILVANEEVSLLDEAMNHLLDSGPGVVQAQLNLFSIGAWESGSFEAVQQWQEYFDQSGLTVSWPTAAETWAFKESLEARELRYFRA